MDTDDVGISSTMNGFNNCHKNLKNFTSTETSIIRQDYFLNSMALFDCINRIALAYTLSEEHVKISSSFLAAVFDLVCLLNSMLVFLNRKRLEASTDVVCIKPIRICSCRFFNRNNSDHCSEIDPQQMQELSAQTNESAKTNSKKTIAAGLTKTQTTPEEYEAPSPDDETEELDIQTATNKKPSKLHGLLNRKKKKHLDMKAKQMQDQNVKPLAKKKLSSLLGCLGRKKKNKNPRLEEEDIEEQSIQTENEEMTPTPEKAKPEKCKKFQMISEKTEIPTPDDVLETPRVKTTSDEKPSKLRKFFGRKKEIYLLEMQEEETESSEGETSKVEGKSGATDENGELPKSPRPQTKRPKATQGRATRKQITQRAQTDDTMIDASTVSKRTAQTPRKKTGKIVGRAKTTAIGKKTQKGSKGVKNVRTTTTGTKRRKKGVKRLRTMDKGKKKRKKGKGAPTARTATMGKKAQKKGQTARKKVQKKSQKLPPPSGN